jgi:molybdate transport repressor ModE-like protein
MRSSVVEFESVERRLKLRDLRVLMRVVQTGSMSEAARQLGTSQPAVSRSISELEQLVGARLLDRDPHGIGPTSYGRALIDRGVAIFDELRQGVRAIKFLADPTGGEVRIGASIIVSVSLVSAVVDQLSRRHARLSFGVAASDTAMALRDLEERKVDLVILHVIQAIPEQRLNVEILYNEPHVVAVGTSSPWARRRCTKLADLMQERWALPPPQSPFGSVVSEAFRNNKLGLPPTVVTSTFPVRNTLLATGRFVTMIPRVALTFPATRPPLKALPIDLPSTPRPLAIITLKNRTLSPPVQLFIESVRELAKPIAKRKP